jgi:hypothetical protein
VHVHLSGGSIRRTDIVARIGIGALFRGKDALSSSLPGARTVLIVAWRRGMGRTETGSHAAQRPLPDMQSARGPIGGACATSSTTEGTAAAESSARITT